MRISGLKSCFSENGKRIFSIQCDELSIRKRKIGFFRIGIINEAELVNAVICIYRNTHAEQGMPGNGGAISPFRDMDRAITRTAAEQSAEMSPGHCQGPAWPRLVFRDIFSKKTFPVLTGRNVAVFRVAPVDLRFYEGSTISSRIKAETAKINLRKGRFIFRGNVRVISGERMMRTGRLMFDPKTFTLSTHWGYNFECRGKQDEGWHLTTDLFLNQYNQYNDNTIRKGSKMIIS